MTEVRWKMAEYSTLWQMLYFAETKTIFAQKSSLKGDEWPLEQLFFWIFLFVISFVIMRVLRIFFPRLFRALEKKIGGQQQNQTKPGKSRAPLIVALVIVAVLAFTNPSTADFKSSGAWNNGIAVLLDDGEINALQAVAYVAIQPGGSVYPIDRSSYLIFSTYRIDNIKFTGIFNRIYVHSDGKLKRVR